MSIPKKEKHEHSLSPLKHLYDKCVLMIALLPFRSLFTECRRVKLPAHLSIHVRLEFRLPFLSGKYKFWRLHSNHTFTRGVNNKLTSSG